MSGVWSPRARRFRIRGQARACTFSSSPPFPSCQLAETKRPGRAELLAGALDGLRPLVLSTLEFDPFCVRRSGRRGTPSIARKADATARQADESVLSLLVVSSMCVVRDDLL